MIAGLASFPYREYGAAVEDGHICPACRDARLKTVTERPPPESDELGCPSCGGLFHAGWRRKVWATSAPATLRGTAISRLGGFFETVQNYASPPYTAPDGELPVHIADFVIDLDRATFFEAATAAETVHAYLDTLAPGQTRVYYSGAKGFHLVLPWQALGASPSQELVHSEYRELAAMIARRTSVVPDYKIYSHARMLRLPDTWHPKTGRYKIEVWPHEILEAESLALVPRGVLNTSRPVLAPDVAELFAEAQGRAERSRITFTPEVRFSAMPGTPPCVESWFREGLPGEGTRHATYLSLARFYFSRGLSLQAAQAQGREFAERDDPSTRTARSVRVRDMHDTVRYVYARELRFSCAGPKNLGSCFDACPLRQIEAHPVGSLFTSGRLHGSFNALS